MTFCLYLINKSQFQLTTFHLYTLLHQIADGQRELIRSHSVKNRHFIGNTSMDAGLSFIMANHAKVKENDLVFDPFVGTGGMNNMQSCRLSHTLGKACVNKWFQFTVFALLMCFRESVGSMFSVWSVCLWNRYRLQHYSWQR